MSGMRRWLGGAPLAVLAGLAIEGYGNNVWVGNVRLGATPTGQGKIEFDLGWDNSWRDGINHDACWLFVKHSTDGGTNWSHATLAAGGTNPAGFSGGAGTALDLVVPADRKGVFVQRAGEGGGSVSNTSLRLLWDLAADGVALRQRGRVKVFAVEMCYVPQGSFYLGDGTTNVVQGQFEEGRSTNAFLVTSEGALTLGGGTPGSLGNNNASTMYSADDFNDTVTAVLPAAFPKGYQAFYVMKTELSQRQYCDFLNTLTAAQQNNRFSLPALAVRNSIRKTGGTPAFFGCDANGNAGAYGSANASLLNESSDGEWMACNQISWMDGCAYADWAGLRPLTELEFEKAARGTLAPVPNEYAWGNTNVDPVASSLANPNTAFETPNQGNCNFSACSPDGPFRCGAFATASTLTRQAAGASYYGVLELTGNLFERTITAGHAAGRDFDGRHGDGALSVNGHANVTNWPGYASGEVTGATGSGFRGGTYYNALLGAGVTGGRISDRYGTRAADTARNGSYGCRLVRTAP